MPDWLMQSFGLAGGAIAAYAAIRADLARINEIADQARISATDAHRRIDRIYDEVAQ
jgi:hypothetical protein